MKCEAKMFSPAAVTFRQIEPAAARLSALLDGLAS